MNSKDDYIKYKLEKADRALNDAVVLMNDKSYESAVSKLYYAVSALLIKKNLNPKTHKGVKALFHKEFIFSQQIDAKYSDFYDMLLAKRFEVDYENFAFVNIHEIPSQLKRAEELITLIKEKLQE